MDRRRVGRTTRRDRQPTACAPTTGARVTGGHIGSTFLSPIPCLCPLAGSRLRLAWAYTSAPHQSYRIASPSPFSGPVANHASHCEVAEVDVAERVDDVADLIVFGAVGVHADQGEPGPGPAGVVLGGAGGAC